MSRWARNSTGAVVHRGDCRHARMPWRWAEGLSDQSMVEFMALNGPAGYRFCATCCGDLRLALDREQGRG